MQRDDQNQEPLEAIIRRQLQAIGLTKITDVRTGQSMVYASRREAADKLGQYLKIYLSVTVVDFCIDMLCPPIRETVGLAY
jgi:hypothetical protein